MTVSAFISVVLLLLTVSAYPDPANQPQRKWGPRPQQPAQPQEHDPAPENTENTEVVEGGVEVETTNNNNATLTPQSNEANSNDTATDQQCLTLLTAFASSGLPQECEAHDDCLGACCTLELLAHKMTYNFTVNPCNPPTVDFLFNITDIDRAELSETYKESKQITIPKGNMSWAGVYETESMIEIVLEKVLDITHFRLDFGVNYRVLKGDPLKPLFTHTLMPMLTLQYNEDLCVKPTVPPKKEVIVPMSNGGDSDKILGIIPPEYVKDKTKLAMVGTIVGLAVVILVGLVYFVISRKRANGAFYRTYISTDENRHLTKGNDGFEPLDDSDID